MAEHLGSRKAGTHVRYQIKMMRAGARAGYKLEIIEPGLTCKDMPTGAKAWRYPWIGGAWPCLQV
jgi:hypothetical protein